MHSLRIFMCFVFERTTLSPKRASQVRLRLVYLAQTAGSVRLETVLEPCGELSWTVETI